MNIWRSRPRRVIVPLTPSLHPTTMAQLQAAHWKRLRRLLGWSIGTWIFVSFLTFYYNKPMFDDSTSSISTETVSSSTPILRTVSPTSSRLVLPKSTTRIYCNVPTQYKSNESLQKWQTILDTWGHKCDVLKFFIDPLNETESLPTKLIHAPTGFEASIVELKDMVRKPGNLCYTMERNSDGTKVYAKCKHIWEKVWRSWVYVSKNDADSADFFFKVDDDTYFIVDRMREIIQVEKNWTTNEHHYFGHKSYPFGSNRGTIVAGACVGWSRKTLKAAAAKYETMEHEYGDRSNFKHGRCVDRDGATEEITTSRCLSQIGVHAEDILDEKKRHRVLVWLAKDLLELERRPNSTSWFWAHQPKDLGVAEHCCSSKPVAIHYMKSTKDMMRLHDLIFDPKHRNELEDVVENKVPIWSQPEYKKWHGLFHRTSPRGSVREAKYFLSVKQELMNDPGIPKESV